MHSKHALSTTAAAVVGGVLGVVTVWLSRPTPPSCTTLANGMRACMPIYVVQPPLWLYAALGAFGSLLAGGAAYALARGTRAR